MVMVSWCTYVCVQTYLVFHIKCVQLITCQLYLNKNEWIENAIQTKLSIISYVQKTGILVINAKIDLSLDKRYKCRTDKKKWSKDNICKNSKGSCLRADMDRVAMLDSCVSKWAKILFDWPCLCGNISFILKFSLGPASGKTEFANF